MKNRNIKNKSTGNKRWNEYLWIASITYLILSFFNILFAWIGMICFIAPLMIAIIKGNKLYCHKYCGRGQLLAKLGSKLSLNRHMPRFMTKSYFRYGFLTFFIIMFLNMVFNTYLVFVGTSNLSEVVTLLWTFKVPWAFANNINISPWITQYAFGFYSVMLTSTIIAVITMILFKPRSFCIYCPMGTMTQGICKLKNRGE